MSLVVIRKAMIRLWREFKSKYPKWVLPTKIGLSLGFIGVILSFISLFLTIFPIHINEGKKLRIAVFEGRKHLGDNIYARVGGISLPTLDDPYRQNLEGLIFWDKEKNICLTTWGSPQIVQTICSYYKNIFEKYNLKAWRHISEVDHISTPEYMGQFIQIDPKTILTWKENKGNFYYRYAPFAWVITINFYKQLMFLNVDPSKQEIKSVKLILTGLHGSKRENQPEQVELLVGNKIYPLLFNSMLLRNEEVIIINLDKTDLNFEPTMSTNFAIIVLPFQEKYPLPPKNSKFEKRGPAHFRDIEVGDSYLEIEI